MTDNSDYRHWPALAGVTHAARDAARPAIQEHGMNLQHSDIDRLNAAELTRLRRLRDRVLAWVAARDGYEAANGSQEDVDVALDALLVAEQQLAKAAKETQP